VESAFVQPWSTGQWMDTIFVVGSVWPLPEQIERVAIVEAPIDALSLAAAGVAALATQGTIWPRVAAAGAGVQEGATGARQ
jgi:hypothetical protein